MSTNIELEFKTKITEEQYNSLIKEFELENNVFPQTNFYFDTPNLDLFKIHTVLRIRQKGSIFKLTKKVRGKNANEADESHIFLQEETALNYLKNGFDANIIELNYQVHNVCELTTYRAKTTYKDGILFFDKSEYYGHVDYEIEYEVDSIEQGKKDFIQFLQEHKIKYEETERKSTRAYKSILNKEL